MKEGYGGVFVASHNAEQSQMVGGHVLSGWLSTPGSLAHMPFKLRFVGSSCLSADGSGRAAYVGRLDKTEARPEVSNKTSSKPDVLSLEDAELVIYAADRDADFVGFFRPAGSCRFSIKAWAMDFDGKPTLTGALTELPDLG